MCSSHPLVSLAATSGASLVVAALALFGCGARPLLPTLSLHAVLVVHKGAIDARQSSSHDYGLQAQLAFRPRHISHPRTRKLDTQVPVALPRQPDCQHALACEWAELAEESTLTALGVAP